MGSSAALTIKFLVAVPVAVVAGGAVRAAAWKVRYAAVRCVKASPGVMNGTLWLGGCRTPREGGIRCGKACHGVVTCDEVRWDEAWYGDLAWCGVVQCPFAFVGFWF